MLNIFKKYRVVEVEGKFIPQCRTGLDWEGIGRDDFFLWSANKNYIKTYCSFETLEDAKSHIEKHKARNKHKNQEFKITKYHYGE
jgi:hypothetical protein